MTKLSVFVLMLCMTSIMATSKKISPQPGLKYFRSDYASVKRTCKNLGFKHQNCVRGKHRIAFTVISKATRRYKPRERIQFPKVKLNLGNGYNNHAYHFAVPRRGHYFISWSIGVYSSYNGHARLMKNGIEYASTHCKGCYQHCGHSLTIYLTRGDTLWLQPTSSGFYDCGGYSVFMGYRLS